MDANNVEGFVHEREPQVLVDKTNDLGVVYKVRFWIYPWKELSPSRSRNVIQTRILEHLDSAGLTLAYPKEDIYHTNMPVRQLETDNDSDRIKLLKKVDLFHVLTDKEIETLSRRLIRKEYPEQIDVVQANDSGNSMFILLEGLLDVMINNGNGQDVKVASITPGNYFGEMSLLTGEKRSATVRTVTECIIYEINRDSFNQVLSVRNSIIDMISEDIAQRKTMNQQLISDSLREENENAKDYKQKLISSIKAVFKIK
jgi:CRP-like cAMP-binding protein